MLKTHKEDRANKGFTVCGIKITPRRISEGRITTTQKKATCFECGENHGIRYFKDGTEFIKSLYNDPKYYELCGEMTVKQTQCYLYHTISSNQYQKSKYVACVNEKKKGFRRCTDIELAMVRVQYMKELAEFEKKETERAARLQAKEDALKAQEKENETVQVIE